VCGGGGGGGDLWFRTQLFWLRFITISFRSLKGPAVPADVLRRATGSCDIYIVSRDKTVKNPADSSSTSGKL
jgi:hypothetical protein